MQRKKYFFRITASVMALCCMLTMHTAAQELNARVTVLHGPIQGVDAKVFTDLQTSLQNLLNNRKWTNDNYKQNEKIDCSFMLNLTQHTSDNIYTGTITVQASRPVYNTTYTSTIVNYVDRDVSFKYDPGQTLLYDDNRITGPDATASNLTALFAYYTYIVLGMEYDSFSPDGGTELFNKARNIVMNAPDDKSISGWKANDNPRDRYWLVDQILNTRYEQFRQNFYTYHRLGLDQMALKPQEAIDTIMGGLKDLVTIYNQNANSVLLQFYFNAKAQEYQFMLPQAPADKRQEYIQSLATVDIPNAGKYRSIK